MLSLEFRRITNHHGSDLLRHSHCGCIPRGKINKRHCLFIQRQVFNPGSYFDFLSVCQCTVEQEVDNNCFVTAHCALPGAPRVFALLNFLCCSTRCRMLATYSTTSRL